MDEAPADQAEQADEAHGRETDPRRALVMAQAKQLAGVFEHAAPGAPCGNVVPAFTDAALRVRIKRRATQRSEHRVYPESGIRFRVRCSRGALTLPFGLGL